MARDADMSNHAMLSCYSYATPHPSLLLLLLMLLLMLTLRPPAQIADECRWVVLAVVVAADHVTMASGQLRDVAGVTGVSNRV